MSWDDPPPANRRLKAANGFPPCEGPADEEAMWKHINDSVHGGMNLEPALVAVVDTPQFQRLRLIRQLGVTEHVYPSGTHNRFEHCLGVAHLAGRMAVTLRNLRPDLVTNRDVTCVKLAGLCHDLGTGCSENCSLATA